MGNMPCLSKLSEKKKRFYLPNKFIQIHYYAEKYIYLHNLQYWILVFNRSSEGFQVNVRPQCAADIKSLN